MWALRVVIITQGGDQIAGMGKVAKQRLVEKLVLHATVETLDEPVLHGLRRNRASDTTTNSARLRDLRKP